MRINQINLYNPIYFKQSYEEKYKDKLFDLEDDIPEDDDCWGFNGGDSRVMEALRANAMQRINKATILKSFEEENRAAYPQQITQISDDSYRGETLVYTPYRLKILKEKGLQCVIDLDGIDGYEQLCKDTGVEYNCMPLFGDFCDNPAFVTKDYYENKVLRILESYKFDTAKRDYDALSRDYIEKIKKFISVINRGNFYIGCNHGYYRTNFALLVNQTFNPEWNGDSALKPSAEEQKFLNEFYNKLTPEDKAELGFTENFENELMKKLGRD